MDRVGAGDGARVGVALRMGLGLRLDLWIESGLGVK